VLGGEDDGIDVGLIDGVSSSNVLIRGNIIQGITDKGISIGEGSQNIRVERNVILDCGNGISVKDSSTAVVDHCTIARTGIGIYAFEKDAGLGGGIVDIRNCIIDHSWERAALADELSTMTISYSLSSDERMYGEQNIFADARFANEYNFEASGLQLSELSPAIDAGDPDGPLDPDGSRADIGTYPYEKSLAGNGESISVYPNPATDILTVVLLSDQRSQTQLEIFDVMGRLVLSTQIPKSTVNVLGNIKFELDLINLSAGQYVLQVRNDAAAYTEKFFMAGR
jgi:parallel beta-helix repeat protein